VAAAPDTGSTFGLLLLSLVGLSAKEYLRRAFEIDPELRLQALQDDDLKPLWDSLQATIDTQAILLAKLI
jgi:hypothetical protein